MTEAPAVGSRWRFGAHGAVYEIVAEKIAFIREGYTAAKIVSATTDEPIGGVIGLRIASLGTTYKPVEKAAK